MSVVLVNAAAKDPHFDQQRSPNLALAYLASVLIEAGLEAHNVDLMYDPVSLDDVIERIGAWGARLVGVSTLTPGFPLAVSLARRIRSAHPDLPIVIGGPHVTFRDAEALSSGAFDVVVRHEGERTLLELSRFFCDGRGELENIAGISFRDGSAVCRTLDRTPIADLDGLPLPARHLAPLEHYRSQGVLSAALITSRGCLYRCQFCNSRRFNRGCRLRSLESCLDELDALAPMGFESCAFVDGNLFARRARTERFLERIQDHHVTWTANVTVQPWIDHSLLERASVAGCSALLIGLESGSDEVLAKTRRPNRVASVLRFVEHACAAGIRVTVGVMVGHPYDTAETLAATVRVSRRLRRLGARVTCAYNTPYPGAYQYDHATELGLSNLDPDWTRYDLAHPVMDTAHLTVADQRAAMSRLEAAAQRKTSAILAWMAGGLR